MSEEANKSVFGEHDQPAASAKGSVAQTILLCRNSLVSIGLKYPLNISHARWLEM